MRAIGVGGVLLGLAAGCGSPETSGTQSGYLEARWTGADTGAVSVPAIAEWCEDRRLLEIRAVAGDTGVALAVFPSVILSADSYRVVAATDSTAPSARVALRLFAPTAIKGFQGDSGHVVLARADSGDLTGTFEARARSVTNTDLVTVTGSFRNLEIVPAMRGCDPDSEPGDTVDVD